MDEVHFKAALSDDQRVDIEFTDTFKDPGLPPPEPYEENHKEPPLMNIVILIVGSRGDVQPFIAIGQLLKAHGHRVRLGTHECFRQFVQDNGLEFYPIAGDPKELMEYMVRTEGCVLPHTLAELREDVPAKRRTMSEIIESTYLACTAHEDGKEPFLADLIVSNPAHPAHIHLAEKLRVPLHMVFTMPWTPTRAFPHPMANLPQGSAEGSYKNYASYFIYDVVVFTGLLDLINNLRRKTLGLKSLLHGEMGSALLNILPVPFTYLWSPAFIPKPQDWGPRIDVVGFAHLFGSGMTDWHPPAALSGFLSSGEPPLFVGFGSCVVQDPKGLTQTVVAAAKLAGLRLIVQRGWGGLGGEGDTETVLFVEAVPHEWLFARVAAVCHHGGAGTTSCGLGHGRPTIVVPFFGDQHFWGAMIHRAGAGPAPIPIRELTTENLAQAMRFCLDPTVRQRAGELGRALHAEDGVTAAVTSLYRHLPVAQMACDVDGRSCAAVHCPTCGMKMSARVDSVVHATGTGREGHKRQPHYYVDWTCVHEPTGITQGLGASMAGTAREMGRGLKAMVVDPAKGAQEDGLKGAGKGAVTGLFKVGVKMPIEVCNVWFDKLGTGLERAGGDWHLVEQKSEPPPQGILRGVATGSKTMALGFVEGVAGMVMEPVHAYRTSGGDKTATAVGAMRGLVGVGLRPVGSAMRGISQMYNAAKVGKPHTGPANRAAPLVPPTQEEKSAILQMYDSACQARTQTSAPATVQLPDPVGTTV
eukprot:TRINITY_DN799_c0_g2_i1.p1 TRINITY_DN799_c0_g2~~TRINITY_DN799_c0_g2_i1.p1  ORF type:complete len:755 (-),score=68.58 TRINITY_DN799_c0_g2_i1:2-2266(-)